MKDFFDSTWMQWAAFIIFICFVILCCGCQAPRTSYMNGVIFWGSTSAIGIGYGEYIEVAPGGKLDRSIKGETDALSLKIDNGEVKAKEVKVKGEGEVEVKGDGNE